MRKIRLAAILLAVSFLLTGCTQEPSSGADHSAAASATSNEQQSSAQTDEPAQTIQEEPQSDEIPAYTDSAYVELNHNQPTFSEEDRRSTDAFELYSELDELGRCGVAYANICEELMPTEERGDIYMVKPTGWQSVKYDFVDNESLYNRCHLIAFCLAGESANEENLITGTRYLNTQGMLPFENMVCDYVKETGNHVLYRVTPMYTGENLVVDGVQIEGWSVEDEGAGICFNVYCYNVQPGVVIDYATGDNYAEEIDEREKQTYILNTNSYKFHLPTCETLSQGKSKNRQEVTTTRDLVIRQGFIPCKTCNP